MTHKTIRLRLTEDLYRKYKVYCAINDLTMTEQTARVVSAFIKEKNESIKIINLDNKK